MQSQFGIKDKYTNNVDILVALREKREEEANGIDIDVNGELEKEDENDANEITI